MRGAPVGLNESEHLDLGSFRNPRNMIATSTLPGVGDASSPGECNTIRYGSIHNLAHSRVVCLSEQGPLLNGDRLESLHRRLFKLPDE
jgi:hypothetical protein